MCVPPLILQGIGSAISFQGACCVINTCDKLYQQRAMILPPDACVPYHRGVITFHTPWNEFPGRFSRKWEGHARRKCWFLERACRDVALDKALGSYTLLVVQKSARGIYPRGCVILRALYGTRMGLSMIPPTLSSFLHHWSVDAVWARDVYVRGASD